MTNETSTPDKIINLVKETKPETVEGLIQISVTNLQLSKETVLQHIIDLENEGRLILHYQEKEIPVELQDYIRSSHATWFWIIIILALGTTLTIFTITEDAYPLIYIRYILGSIFILFLPGYCLIKTLFPSREIDDIERAGLSIGTSLVIVPLIGLVLNYTSLGIRLTPITLSLLILTVVLAITGLIREHQEKNANSKLLRTPLKVFDK
ncbi:MAG: DUF1616 domain-containing protein [Candidatus Hodarchaeales archaeon]|jgi:hypothetical protein